MLFLIGILGIIIFIILTVSSAKKGTGNVKKFGICIFISFLVAIIGVYIPSEQNITDCKTANSKNTKTTVNDTSTSKIEDSVKTNTKSNKKDKRVEKSVNNTKKGNYNNVKTGMTYEQVKNILGEGKEQASSSVAGIVTKCYEWRPNGEITDVMFQNNKVINKAHGSLTIKTASKKITLGMYNKIKTGMSYQQTKAILGEGKEMSKSELAGIKTVMYSWMNPDGSSMNAIFQNNKLNTKAQVALK